MLFVLSKILPLFFLPLGFSLILIVYGLCSRKRWPFFILLSILSFFSLGLTSQFLWHFLESPWQRRTVSQAPHADAIVVLSGALHPAPGPERVTEWQDPDRFLAGVDLFHAGKSPRLLFTGGVSPFLPGHHPEGYHYLRLALQQGIPASAISVTSPVVNTAEEAAAIRYLFPSSNSRILLVTSAFHMYRAKRLFEQQGFKVLPFPVDFQSRGSWAGSAFGDPTQFFPSADSLNQSSRALRELFGRLIYLR